MQATTSAPSFWLWWSYGVQKTACYTGPPLPPVLTVFLFSLHCLSLWVYDIRGTVCDQESHRHLLSSRWQAVISVSTATHSTEELNGWGLLKSTSFNWFFFRPFMFKVVFDMVVWQLWYLVDDYFQLIVSFPFSFSDFPAWLWMGLPGYHS